MATTRMKFATLGVASNHGDAKMKVSIAAAKTTKSQRARQIARPESNPSNDNDKPAAMAAMPNVKQRSSVTPSVPSSGSRGTAARDV